MRFVFIAISWIASAGIIYFWIKNLNKYDTWIDVVYALCLGGALGNAIDRTFYWESTVGFSGVIDWIQVFFGDYAFPMFNLADSALVVGVAILLVYVIIDSIKESVKAGKEGQYKYSPNQLKEAEKAKDEDSQNK